MPRPVLEWEKRLGRRLTLHDLHILKAVAQSGSMAQAARALGMSQPSVSEAIAKLEAALRVRLLDRGPRGIEPTIYADALLWRESRSCPMSCSRGSVTSSFWQIPLPERYGSDVPRALQADLCQPSSTGCRARIQKLRFT